jgi:rod shape-determining protein MreD
VILTPQIYVRIGLLLLAGVIFQVSFLSDLSVMGATPYILPVLVVCLGLLGGAVIGAVCGFAAGLLLDSALLQTLGVSSLVLLAVGYLAGRYRENFELSSPLIPPTLAAGLTLFASFVFGAIQLMLGIDAPVSLLILREIVLQTLLSFVLAVPLYPFVRWLLRPALIEDTGRRRPRRPSAIGAR